MLDCGRERLGKTSLDGSISQAYKRRTTRSDRLQLNSSWVGRLYRSVRLPGFFSGLTGMGATYPVPWT